LDHCGLQDAAGAVTQCMVLQAQGSQAQVMSLEWKLACLLSAAGDCKQGLGHVEGPGTRKHRSLYGDLRRGSGCDVSGCTITERAYSGLSSSTHTPELLCCQEMAGSSCSCSILQHPLLKKLNIALAFKGEMLKSFCSSQRAF
jgi:hypothetical protein